MDEILKNYINLPQITKMTFFLDGEENDTLTKFLSSVKIKEINDLILSNSRSLKDNVWPKRYDFSKFHNILKYVKRE